MRLKQPESCQTLDATFVSFESPSEILCSRGPSLILFRRSVGRGHLLAVPAPAQDSSLGVAKDPLRRTPHCLSTPASSRSRKTLSRRRRQLAKAVTRSVLAVPPDFNGFLQAVLRGLVASRSRSWGSPRFRSISHVCRGQGSAQSGPSPLAAAFAASPARRPILAAASDWPFPKEPVECYKNSPSEPSLLHPKMSRPLPWTSYPTPKDRIRLCSRRPPESGLRMLPRLVPPNPKVLLHRYGTCGLSTIPNGASTLRSFPLNSS